MNVSEWMTTDPITLRTGTSVGEARTKMEQSDIRHFPVVEDDGTMLGMVTWSDVTDAWPSRFGTLEPHEIRGLMSRILVDEIMVTEVITADGETTVSEAANLMFEHRIGALPITRDSRIVGILSNSDILQGLVRILALQARRDAAGT